MTGMLLATLGIVFAVHGYARQPSALGAAAVAFTICCFTITVVLFVVGEVRR